MQGIENRHPGRRGYVVFRSEGILHRCRISRREPTQVPDIAVREPTQVPDIAAGTTQVPDIAAGSYTGAGYRGENLHRCRISR